MSPDTALRIVSVYPRLLGTYGDSGNVDILVHRAVRRGLQVDVRVVEPGQPVPDSGDIYLLGGGEDEAQRAALELLRGDRAMASAVEAGAAVLAVCAGLQLLGERFSMYDGSESAGLGLLDAVTTRRVHRAVGEVVARPLPEHRLPLLTGFENHGGATHLGPSARPLAIVSEGVGNGVGDGSEGIVQGRIIGTYLHGPVLARNPALADHLLMCAVGPLMPLVDTLPEALRAERLAAVAGGSRGRWWPARRRLPRH